MDNEIAQIHTYLNSMSGNALGRLQQSLLQHNQVSPRVKQILSRPMTIDQMHSTVDNEGAGFAQLLKTGINLVNPWHWKQIIGAAIHNAKHSNKMNQNSFEMAQMAKDVYSNTRQNINGWQYLNHLSNKDHAVYSNGSQYRLSIKGTSQLKDILPDLKIIAGTQNSSRDFKNSLDYFRNLRAQTGTTRDQWQVVGHSLGGSKAMWIAQNENIQSHAFNPGYHNATDDRINTRYQGNNLYFTAGDPISNTMLFNKLPNATLLPAQGINPLKNHTIDNFVNPNVIQRS